MPPEVRPRSWQLVGGNADVDPDGIGGRMAGAVPGPRLPDRNVVRDGLTPEISVYTLNRMPPVETTCVCTTLRMATRSVCRLYDRALSQAGLRATGYAILSVLATEGRMPISELAGRLAMDRTTCTRELAPLVSAKLVEIAAGPDRRYRMPRLTSLGEQKRARARPAWEQVQHAVADEFGHVSISDLLADLRGLLASSERLNSA